MTHGHEVLHMMEGHSYATREELIAAIEEKFGPDEQFCTCSAAGMSAAQLVEFLEARGKFKPADGDTFTVDSSKICKH